MTKKLITLLVVALTASCAQLEYEKDASPVLREEMIETVYHPATNTVLAKVSEASRLISTKAEDATHYAVKFFPKNTNELFTLIRAENVMTSYYPFGYMPTAISKTENNPSINGFDANPYSETYFVDDSSSKVFQTELPVIYAYWPISMTIPEEIEHEICYSVNLPLNTIICDNNLRGPIQPGPYPLYIRTYDSLLSTYIPMRNLKVRASYGGVWVDKYTDDNGYVIFDPMAENIVSTLDQLSFVTITIIYQTSDWIVSLNSSTTPIHTVIGTVGLLWGMPDDTPPSAYYYNLASSTKECEIHRAVDYYHNSIHQLSSYLHSSESGIILHATDTVMTFRGRTRTYTNASPTCYFYLTTFPQADYIGSVLHELGHVHQYYKRGGTYYLFENINSLIKDSYASYVGWLIGESYYTSKGYIKSTIDEDICSQSRQTWIHTMTLGHDYSPLFIDLIDQFDQSLSGSLYAVDVISGFPIERIEYMGGNYSTLQDYKTYLQSLVGIYYTQSEINTQLSFY